MQEQILFNFDAVQHGATLAPTRTCCAASFEIETKRCARCLVVKPLDDFSPLFKGLKGRQPHCKKCRNAFHKRQDVKQRYAEKRRVRQREWRKSPERLKKKRDYMRQYVKKNTVARISQNMRARIWYALRGGKTERTAKLVGCSMAELKRTIEKLFKPGMTWDNYGKWHIDHIRPCSSFDLSKPEEQAACFHYTNLQPLWAYENLSKGNKLTT